MSTFLEILNAQLSQSQKNSSADWAAIIRKNDVEWEIICHSKIKKPIIKVLKKFISENETWLKSTLSSSRVRYKSLKDYQGLIKCQKIFCFASAGEASLILVGANKLNNKELSSFKLIAKSLEYLSSQTSLQMENERISKELDKKNEAQQIAEDRLIQSAKLAAVGEMAAGVAHELNNPLTTVSGFAELILDSLPKESPNYEDMTLILMEARRARAVVRRLLDFSRQSEILRLDADINEILSTVLALVHHLAEMNNVKISVLLWNEIPMIHIDKDQIQQVFLNLIHNAIQAMPMGGELDIETQVNLKDDKNWVTIIIKDNGKGIKDKDIQKIFKPFFTTKETGKGTGLGLSISYRIIADHGGYIEVNSILNNGSSFAVWLPVENINENENGVI